MDHADECLRPIDGMLCCPGCVGPDFFQRARCRCPSSNGDLYVLRFCTTFRKIWKMRPPAVFGMRNDYSDVVPRGVTFQALIRATERAAGLLPLTSLDGWNRLAMTNDRADEEGKLQSRSPQHINLTLYTDPNTARKDTAGSCHKFIKSEPAACYRIVTNQTFRQF